MMSMRMAALLLFVMAAIIAGGSVMLWATGNVAAAILNAAFLGTIWFALIGLCVWAWRLGP